MRYEPRVWRFAPLATLWNKCAVVNPASDTNDNHGKQVNSLSQTMTIGPTDVDPSDSKVHIRFAAAPVLQNPSHAANEQPYYFVQVTNVTKANAVIYSDFNLSAQAGIPWKTVGTGVNEIDYTDWQLVDIQPTAAQVSMGDMVKLEVIAAGCSLGGHYGYVYLDGVGATVPGIFISGSAPAQVNACGNLTYTLTYHNGAATPETGVVVDFTTPPGTTYQSFTPPTGAVCIAPLVGTAGTVTCTFAGPLAAGAVGTMTVTVNVNCAATGTIDQGNYDIKSTQESAISGNHVITTIGCTQDSNCSAGTWCDETLSQCTPTLPNGVLIPNDPPHTNPVVNGMCTLADGALVCTAGVCDATNNRCGYANGDGPCTPGAGASVCQSAVCDTDDLCGFKNGDGPCTILTAGVCRSGVCSLTGVCIGVGGCTTDGDCTGGKWCDESTSTCTPKLPNGQPIPSDPPHSNPTLNATCTSAAAMLVCTSGVCDPTDNKCGFKNSDGPCTPGMPAVCRSGVCDTDDLCGFKNGDGPCTGVTQTIVCRSGTCSTNLLCEPSGGCNTDADCTAGNWCDESTNLCKPQLPNGTVIPTDPPHTLPTLNGNCTPGAGALVCQSLVCDTTNNECGFANGDGPCTVATGPTVCQSGVCSVNGTCEPSGGCNIDADCATGNWCNETAHMCTPKLANGQPVPTDTGHVTPVLNGMCTVAAGAVVCLSGVCDPTDNKCGFADGDGPCTVATQMDCRSGACSTNGTCEPSGGCNVDADCTTGNWCDETQHMCTPQVANGQPVPTDTSHMNPTLNGTCTTAGGVLTCVSGVCDTADNKCGFANGDGPCTGVDGATVCRSAICATTGANTGKCEGCTMDGQCPGTMPHCDTTTNGGVMFLVDSDCGGTMSGQVCNDANHDCQMGCRGTGGNGCPTGQKCTSTDNTIGMCVTDTMTTSSSSSSTGTNTGTGTSTSSSTPTGSTGSGTGGSSNTQAFAQGHGIFGCSVSNDASEGSDASPMFLGGFAALFLVGARRRKRAARGCGADARRAARTRGRRAKKERLGRGAPFFFLRPNLTGLARPTSPQPAGMTALVGSAENPLGTCTFVAVRSTL